MATWGFIFFGGGGLPQKANSYHSLNYARKDLIFFNSIFLWNLFQEISRGSSEMIFNLPKFEIKNISENDWNRFSEKDFLLKLENTFELISPVLSDLFQGKEIITNSCIYRINFIHHDSS